MTSTAGRSYTGFPLVGLTAHASLSAQKGRERRNLIFELMCGGTGQRNLVPYQTGGRWHRAR